jgi:hypothetical protein
MDLFGGAERKLMVAEYQHICAVQQAIRTDLARLSGLVERLVAEMQGFKSAEDRIEGRAERLEMTFELLLEYLHDAGAVGVPKYPQTQAEIPNLEERRARVDGRRRALGSGGMP